MLRRFVVEPPPEKFHIQFDIWPDPRPTFTRPRKSERAKWVFRIRENARGDSSMRACPTAVETKCTKRRVERARVEVRAGLLLMPKVLTSLSDRGRCNRNNNNNSNNIMPLISAGYTDLSPPTAPKTAQDAYPRFLAIRRQFDDNFVSILLPIFPLISDRSSPVNRGIGSNFQV